MDKNYVEHDLSYRVTPYPTGDTVTYTVGINAEEHMSSISNKADKDGKYRTGGSWYLSKKHCEISPTQYDSNYYTGKPAYSGPVFVRGSHPLVTDPSLGELKAKGTHAIAMSIPTNPHAGLATFLGELRNEFPHMLGTSFLKDRTAIARNAGDEYLNVEFGWKPMVSDLRKIGSAVKDAHKIIAQAQKGSGQTTRRSYSFPSETSTTGQKLSLYPEGYSWMNPAGTSSVAGEIIETLIRNTWFEGAFTYLLPVGDTAAGKVKEFEAKANILLGTRLTPEVVWNLAPWSWFADWNANVGDIVHNWSAFSTDGLVMKYGYVMCETIARRTYAAYGLRLIDSYKGEISAPLSAVYTTTVKMRIPGSPYGFDLKPVDYSTKQVAILVALGLSHGPT